MSWFHHPMPVSSAWPLFLPPLLLAVALVYRTLKTTDLRRLPREAGALFAQMLLLLTLAAVVLWVLTEL